MALLPPRNRKRWIGPLEAVYLLGIVEVTPRMTPEQVEAAEESAIGTLRKMAGDWGIVKVKRSNKKGSGCAYTEESLLAYMAEREIAV